MGLKTSILFGSIMLSTQLYASSLQTANSVNHTTPKVVLQDETKVISQSLEIKPYGKLIDLNNRSDVFLSHYPASQARHPFIDEGEFLESVSSNSPNEGIDFEQNPFIYGSGYHDTESSLEYMGARYYSADIGRFVAQDSFDLLNRYNYGNANPIMTIDPDGHLAWGLLPDTWGGAIGMIVGIAVGAAATGLIGYSMLVGAIVDGASSAGGDFIQQAIDNRGINSINAKEVLASAVLGAVTGAISSKIFANKTVYNSSEVLKGPDMKPQFYSSRKKFREAIIDRINKLKKGNPAEKISIEIAIKAKVIDKGVFTEDFLNQNRGNDIMDYIEEIIKYDEVARDTDAKIAKLLPEDWLDMEPGSTRYKKIERQQNELREEFSKARIGV